MTGRKHGMAQRAGTATGGRKAENFPVASILTPRPLRPAIHALYDFARLADDIADDPALPVSERIARLDAAGAVLDGRPALAPPGTAAMITAARRLRLLLDGHGIPLTHAHDLLFAFATETTLARIPSWDALVGLCTLSAVPAGRIVLGFYGEATADESLTAASDALCTAFQILDHVQDCGMDYLRLARVYVPADWCAAAGVGADAFGLPRVSLALRDVLDRCLDGVRHLLRTAAPLPERVRSVRLAAEAGAALALAHGLMARLRRRDPLAGAVRVGPAAALVLAASGAAGALARRRRARSRTAGGAERG